MEPNTQNAEDSLLEDKNESASENNLKKYLIITLVFIVIAIMSMVALMILYTATDTRDDSDVMLVAGDVEKKVEVICEPLKLQRERSVVSANLVEINPGTSNTGGQYYKDEKCVYHGDWWFLKDADLETIEVIGHSVAKDKNVVYFGSSPKYVYDAKSFEIISGRNIFKDKNAVYIGNEKIENVDPDKFVQLDPENNTSWWKDGTNAYYVTAEGYEIIEGVDLDTFRVIKNGLAADKSAIYVKGIPLEDSRPETLLVIDNDVNVGGVVREFYSKTETYVFWGEEVLDKADSGTFKYLGNYLALDKNNVYRKGEVVDGADSSSFVIVNEYFSKDDDRVYFLEGRSLAVVAGTDPNTIRPLCRVKVGYCGYDVVDINNVYHYHNGLPSTNSFLALYDLGSLESIGGLLMKDKNGVYLDGQLLSYVDKDTIEYVGQCAGGMFYGGSYLKDKNSVYISQEVSGPSNILTASDIDVATFEYFGIKKGAKDKNHVYHLCDQIREGEDPDTFDLYLNSPGNHNTVY